MVLYKQLLLFVVSTVCVIDSLQLLPLRHRFQKKIHTYSEGPGSGSDIISIAIPSDTSENDAQKIVDDYLMGLALDQAREAGEKYGEVPIGALVAETICDSSKNITTEEGTGTGTAIKVSILSYGQNQIETHHDASAHAETQSLRAAAKRVKNWRLLNATLYSTLEPCPMCLSASQAFRVKRIVYGAPDLRLGAVETYMNLLDYPHPFHNSDAMEVVGGVRAEEAKTLLVDFFRERRKRSKRQKKERLEGKEIRSQTSEESPEGVETSRLQKILRKFRGKNRSK